MARLMERWPGLGASTQQYLKFFVEARYRQIGPNDSKESFVPIQAGIRF